MTAMQLNPGSNSRRREYDTTSTWYYQSYGRTMNPKHTSKRYIHCKEEHQEAATLENKIGESIKHNYT